MKSIKKTAIKNKKIILNTELNVPLSEDGEILDDARLVAGMETINYIMSKEPTILLLVGHIGRPSGEIVPKLSTELLVKKMEELSSRRVVFIEKLEKLQATIQSEVFDSDAVYLLENIRFWRSEEENREAFGRDLGELFDVYINDNFSTSHREHASFVQVPKFTKQAVAGILLEKEIKNLSAVRDKPKKPAIAIIGGSKIKTKLPVIENLIKKYDKILVGGKVANEALDENIKFDKKVILPVDFSPAEKETERLDIGPLTAASFRREIQKAKTIVWNGPLGKFEDEESSNGTRNIIEAVEKSRAFKLVGGGETSEAIKMFGNKEKYDYISQSGGAMLKFLARAKLPGIEALN
jgi:phosphoglycerate kinase